MATAYLSPGVYMEEVSSGSKPIEGVGTAVAAFVGFAEKGPVGEPTLVTNWSQFAENFGGFVEGGYLASSVYGYFANGGGIAYITRLPGDISANGNGKAGELAAAPRAALPGRGNAALTNLEFTAQDSGTGDVTVEVSAAEDGAPEDQFTLKVKRGDTEEAYPNVSLNRGRNVRNVVEVVNRESKLVKVAERETNAPLLERTPAAGTYALAKPETAALAKTTSSLPDVSTVELIGEAAERTGILGFEVAETVTMVAVPDLMAAYQQGKITMDGVKAVQIAMMDHCSLMKDRVAILDCPPGLNPQQVRDWRMNVAGYDSKYAALYYPWIQVANPKGGDPILIPPSGHMAGLWARVDGERGVHKAPANEIVMGALGLEKNITKGEQDTLNPIGVNCIRAFPGRGIRVWGARTISSDPEWRYLNVRRLFNYVEKSIENGTQWTVFEPNDMDLWERVKRNISAFLTRVWADGALFGATADEAFFVKCDAELNTEAVRDAGQLIVEIGIAPVKPAEFVIFRISQYSQSAG